MSIWHIYRGTQYIGIVLAETLQSAFSKAAQYFEIPMQELTVVEAAPQAARLSRLANVETKAY